MSRRQEAEAAPWTVWVLTLYPSMFPGPLGYSLAGKALEQGLWRLETVDIRDYARDKHRTVDEAPFGGGPGMVMRADVLAAAVEGARAGAGGSAPVPLVYLGPRGRPLDQARVRELAAGAGVILICGRYEGVDERALEELRVEEISLGDFVLSSGEPAALALIDAVVRWLPGVIGDANGLIDESFEDGLLEYPHYTRPRSWHGREVPPELLSGHHERIREWRLAAAERMTQARRPDLWARYAARRKARQEGGE